MLDIDCIQIQAAEIRFFANVEGKFAWILDSYEAIREEINIFKIKQRITECKKIHIQCLDQDFFHIRKDILEVQEGDCISEIFSIEYITDINLIPDIN